MVCSGTPVFPVMVAIEAETLDTFFFSHTLCERIHAIHACERWESAQKKKKHTANISYGLIFCNSYPTYRLTRTWICRFKRPWFTQSLTACEINTEIIIIKRKWKRCMLMTYTQSFCAMHLHIRATRHSCRTRLACTHRHRNTSDLVLAFIFYSVATGEGMWNGLFGMRKTWLRVSRMCVQKLTLR